MNSWPNVSLGEVFDIARGGSPRPIQKFLTQDPNGINWVMIGDALENSKYISSTKNRIIEEGVKKSRMVQPGDFLLTNSMSFGKPYIMNTSGCIHDGWLVLSPSGYDVDPDFFYYLLGSDFMYTEFTRRAAGATVKNLNINLVKGVTVTLPPLEEQKRIAGILDAADMLRAKRREALARLDDLLQSTFLDLFGDPVTNPKGWEKGTLSDIVERLDGGKNIAQSETETDYRVLKVSAVTSGQYRPLESKYLPADFEVPESYLVKKGDLLISRANTAELIGATAYVWQTPKNIALPDKIWKFIWKKDVPSVPLFIYHLSQQTEFRHILSRRASGTSGSMKNIAKPKLLSLPIYLPPLDLQRRFAEIVSSVEEQKAKMRKHLEQLDDLFASLQQRAFRGDL